MNASFRKYFPLIIILGFFLGMYLLWQWGIDPVKRNIRSMLDKREETKILEEATRKRLGELPELERQYALIRENGGVLDIFTNREDIVRFIEAIEKTAEKSGVTISIESKELEKKKSSTTAKERKDAADAKDKEGQSAPEKKKDESILGNLPFQEYLSFVIHVTGKYPEVGLFLHRLETIPFALDVVSINIHFVENEEAPKKPGGDLLQRSLPTETSSNSTAVEVVSEPEPEPEPEPNNFVEGTFSVVVYVKN